MEILLIITMLSVTILPFALVVGQLSDNARGGHIQSSRSLLMNSLLAEMDAGRNNFTAIFNDAGKNTSYSESGQTLPFMRKVDVATAGASNSMRRTVNFYLYNNASDADTAPYYRNRVVLTTDRVRLRTVSNGAGLIDSSNNFWFADHNLLYNTVNKVPGPVLDYLYDGTIAGDITNTTGNDDALYQYNRYKSNVPKDMDYNFDVDNGPYVVKLYFADINPAINSTNNRRIFNITIEGVQHTVTPYSPAESVGAPHRAVVKMYDTVVTDGVLNVRVSLHPASNNASVFLNAIQILKRDL